MPDAPILAVHSLDHFVMAVPDLGQAAHFYTSFGLDVRSSGDGLSLHAQASDHSAMRLVAGARMQLRGLSFGVYADDLPRFAERLRQRGVPCTDTASASGDPSLQFRDPDGTPITLIVAAKTSPSAPGGAAEARKEMAPKRSQAPRTQPTHFSHILLFCTDVDASVDFYSEVLGLRLSDRGGHKIAFMHTPHGSDHHLVAFVKSDGPGLHHSSWNVRTIDEIGLGARQLAAQGYRDGWGVGRHVLGSNYFYYAADPWGGYIEYSHDMDFIAAGHAWTAATHDDEDAFFVWGPEPPATFADNTELR